MKKKSGWINWVIIVAILGIAFFIISKPAPAPQTEEEAAICIGEKSLLYVQLGCPHCEDQKELFGEYYKHLNVIDCFYERDKCSAISATPTWVIGFKELQGVQSIETLMKETGCEIEAAQQE